MTEKERKENSPVDVSSVSHSVGQPTTRPSDEQQFSRVQVVQQLMRHQPSRHALFVFLIVTVGMFVTPLAVLFGTLYGLPHSVWSASVEQRVVPAAIATVGTVILWIAVFIWISLSEDTKEDATAKKIS